MQNRIFFHQTKSPLFYRVELFLSGCMKPKFIGTFDKERKIFKTSRNENHLHRKSNSLAFNYQFIKDNEVELIEVDYLDKKLYITKTHLLRVGSPHQFKASGNELQIFCQLHHFSKSPQQARLKDEVEPTLFGAMA